jgi:hypothetical protein
MGAYEALFKENLNDIQSIDLANIVMKAIL